VVLWLGRPADKVQMPVTDWPDLIVETSGDPYAMQQTEQDRLATNPRWSPNYASESSASNSAYYFAHATREAARVVFRHGLWPAALAIWQRGIGGGQAARWSSARPMRVGWMDI
jgi:CO/xanthine dehydrogenase Mo-binding subunit